MLFERELTGIFCSIMLVLLVPGSARLSDEERLLRFLFKYYNPSARPVINSSKTVNVEIMFSLLHIKELDVRSQVLTTTGLLILQWTDERLRWEPKNQNDMTVLITEAAALWRPEFAVINGAEKIYENYNNFRAIISYDGVIRWEPGGVFKTMCQIDITYYPFDEQVCQMVFGAWSYHTSKMNLTNVKDTINLDSYNKNGEWEIITTTAQRNEFFYECCPNERFSNVVFTVQMRRRHTFYIMNVILPSILTSVLLLSIFFCTPAQKVQIGVVVLLSFRIFLLNVADNIPKTSDHIPLLGIYLTCTMAITTLSMVLTVLVLNLHYITDRPVPMWLRTLTLFYIAKILGMGSANYKPVKKKKPPRTKSPSASGHYNCHYRRASVNADTEDSGVAGGNSIILETFPTNHQASTSRNYNTEFGGGGTALNHMTTHIGPSRSYNAELVSAGRNHSNTQMVQMSSPRISYSPEIEESEEEEEEPKKDFGKEWTRVAEVFDRLFFWLFLMAITVSTLVLFHPLTDSYVKSLKNTPA